MLDSGLAFSGNPCSGLFPLVKLSLQPQVVLVPDGLWSIL
jgi:hypothetical protein